jgi:uncharacterized protein (DUF2147 family)
MGMKMKPVRNARKTSRKKLVGMDVCTDLKRWNPMNGRDGNYDPNNGKEYSCEIKLVRLTN